MKQVLLLLGYMCFCIKDLVEYKLFNSIIERYFIAGCFVPFSVQWLLVRMVRCSGLLCVSMYVYGLGDE